MLKDSSDMRIQNPGEMVCYCFNYRAKDIINDVLANEGRSTIIDRISREKREGGCRCSVVHPEKR